MALDWTSSLKEINGINLTNYFPQRRSYNSVVFVHKKYLEECKSTATNEEKKEKVRLKKDKKNKEDKCQQFNYEKHTETSRDKMYKFSYNNDNSILEQTIRFAKNIVPLAIPPNEDKSNVFYTIKTSRKHKKKDKKHRESISEPHDSPRERDDVTREPKKVETYRKVRKESFSVRESVSHSSNNTLDDLNINQSLCCTFSETSEKKYHKKDKNLSKRLSHGQKLAISESFEAVATENATGDAHIKIHLMNDKEKHFLSESIKEPILKAIRECISELNNNNLNTEITTVHHSVKCNAQKLDNILDKLTCIENKLDSHEKILYSERKKLEAHEEKLDSHKKKLDNQEKKLDSHEKKINIYETKLVDTQARKPDPQVETKTVPLPKVQDGKPKASILEDLGGDLIEIKEEEYSSEEELHQELLDRRSKSSIVTEIEEERREEKKLEYLGGGEVARITKGSASMGSKLERPNRIPARFCWTDAAKKN